MVPKRSERANDNTRPTLRSSLGFGALSSLALLALGLFGSVLTARLYGIRVLGEFALISVPYLTAMSVSATQQQAALTRELAPMTRREPRATGLAVAVWSIDGLVNVTVSLLAAGLVVWAFNGPVNQPALIPLALAGLAMSATLMTPSWNIDVIFAAFQGGRELATIRVSQAAFLLCTTLALGLWQQTPGSLLAATAGAALYGLVARIWLLRRFLRFHVPRAELRAGFAVLPEMIRFGLRLMPRSFAVGVSGQSGTWVLGALGTVAALGAYNRAQQLALRLLDTTYRANEVLFPALVARRQAGDTIGYERALIDTARYAAAIFALPAAVGAGAAAGVMEVFGPGFEEGAEALAVLLWVPVLSIVATTMTQSLISHDAPGTASLVAIGRAIVTLALVFPLTKAAGAAGAAGAYAAGYVVELVVLDVIVRRKVGIPVFRRWGARPLLAQAVACAVGAAAARWLDVQLGGFGGTALALLVGTVVYVASFVLTGGTTPTDRERFRSLRARRVARATQPA